MMTLNSCVSFERICLMTHFLILPDSFICTVGALLEPARNMSSPLSVNEIELTYVCTTYHQQQPYHDYGVISYNYFYERTHARA